MSFTGEGHFLELVIGTWLRPVGASSPSRFRFSNNYGRLSAVTFAAATLAACAGNSVVNNTPEPSAVSQQTPPEKSRHASPVTLRTAKHIPPAANIAGAKTFYGVASFYKDDTETASGEKFDPHQLTAAHPTLPFGTHLRVTSVDTGQSVTVRVNDRGPFIPGRNVDLSYSAAESLGMVQAGLTKVKLEVVR